MIRSIVNDLLLFEECFGENGLIGQIINGVLNENLRAHSLWLWRSKAQGPASTELQGMFQSSRFINPAPFNLGFFTF